MSVAAPSNRQSSRIAVLIAGIAIIAGVGLRAWEFTRGRPLWLDEAMLSINIASRSLTELARTLDYDQSAPLLYLWIERMIVGLGGVSETTLRTLPFIAGLALVPLVWIVARRVAGDTTAAIATVLVTFSVSLISFGAEAKQYGVDPLATVVAVWLATRVIAAVDDRRAWMTLIAGGAGCLLLSQPAVFALGGVVFALAVDPDVRRSRSARAWMLVAAAIWAVVFVALYLLVYRSTADSAYMRTFWEGTFLDPRAGDFALRLRMFAIAAFSSPFLGGSASVPPFVFALAWIAGIGTVWVRSRFAAVVIGTPVVLAVVASALGYYPVIDRLFLFAAPLTMMAFAAIVASVVERVPAARRQVAFVGVACVVAAVAAPAHVRRITSPVFFAVGKQIVADVDSMSRGDAVYVAARSFPLWVYYTTDWSAPDTARLRWAASISGAGAPAHNNAPPSGRVQRSRATALARPYRGRLEIVGLPTGRQFRTTTRSLDPQITAAELALPLAPDSGWAQLEVQRMAPAARPRVWVFGSHMFALDGAEPGLVAELQARGVRLLMERRQGSTVAYHVEFPAEP